ncbi:hypothetical protein NKH24_35360 [Mesorhizobium sp. M1300]|uniref:hypothetical protein n=1 Tax=Mesorhizobium sp. M1300 TaxID=2957077 RepID=UPI0033351812
MAAAPAEVEPESEPVEETAEQKAYRGDRPREQLTSPSDIENYEALGTGIFRKKTEAEGPVEVAKRLPEAPVIIGPHTEFDIEKIAALSPWRRNAIADHIRVLKAGLPTHATLNDQHSLAQAKLHLSQFVKK